MRLDQVISKGTFAARPAVGTVPNGSLYLATDNLILYQKIGGAWAIYFELPTGPGLAGLTAQTIPVATAADEIEDSQLLQKLNTVYTGYFSDDPIDAYLLTSPEDRPVALIIPSTHSDPANWTGLALAVETDGGETTIKLAPVAKGTGVTNATTISIRNTDSDQGIEIGPDDFSAKLGPDDACLVVGTTAVRPETDDLSSLGDASHRFKGAFLSSLPTSDPAVPGQLYRVAGAVMISL